MRDTLGDVFKRALDLFGSLVGLVILTPVFLIIAVAILWSDPGPVFFRQQRVGRYGKPFKIIKFRSMRTNAERVLRDNSHLWEKYVANGYKLPEGEDPRLTGIGRWLRKTSLDELPQLINVLLGEMSLVGPRPLLQVEVDEWYAGTKEILVSVRPGMTGLWQVEGRSQIPYPERSRIELRYVDQRSFWVDLRILRQTVSVVLRRQGAH